MSQRRRRRRKQERADQHSRQDRLRQLAHHASLRLDAPSGSSVLGLPGARPPRWRRTTSTKASASNRIAASATIAATGAFELSGTQNNWPSTTPFCAPTEIGTLQWKINVRLLWSLTCGGVTGLIQGMRWSCHSKPPLLSTPPHLGGSLALADGGTVPLP